MFETEVLYLKQSWTPQTYFLSLFDLFFQMVQKYLLNTHASTHSMYTMELLDAFKCEKEGEDARFKDLGNK